MRKFKRGKITREQMEQILDEKVEKEAKHSYKKKNVKHVSNFKV